MWAPALGSSARVARTCLSLFSLLIRLVLTLLCELASLSQTVSLLTYLLPCDLRKLPQMTAAAFHFCPVCWQSQVCTWLVSCSTRSWHQSAVHLSTYRCPNSYTQPVSCKLNYKCFYICFKCALGWGRGGMCHSTSIEVMEQLVNARVSSSMTWVPGVKFWSLGLEHLLAYTWRNFNTAVLNLWVSTPLEVDDPLTERLPDRYSACRIFPLWFITLLKLQP